LNLSWTTVTAPVAGVAGRAEKSEGNLISSTDNLLTSIYQLNPIWARFALGESDLARFPGKRVSAQDVKTVELVLSDGSVYPKRGKLNFVASTVDPTLGAQQLRAEFDNAEQLILPGQFVRVRLVTGERQGVFLVPQTAVAQGEQGARVMTVGADNKATPRPVQAGEWLGKDWVILGGLKAGDKVIIDNLIKLKPGMPVKPRAPGEAPAGGDKPAADGKKG
jgi:membrane fusion protein (multidrug efflux system)